MIYSASRINSFKRCPRAFYYHYILKYREFYEKPWLRIGKAVDDLLSIYDTDGYETMMDKIDTFFTDPHEKVVYTCLLEHYHDVFKDEILEPTELDGRPGNQWHFEYHLDPDNVDTDIKIQGYLDKAITKDGRLGLIERKTTAANISYVSDYWKTLPMDNQLSAYLWAEGLTVGGHVGLASAHLQFDGS